MSIKVLSADNFLWSHACCKSWLCKAGISYRTSRINIKTIGYQLLPFDGIVQKGVIVEITFPTRF